MRFVANPTSICSLSSHNTFLLASTLLLSDDLEAQREAAVKQEAARLSRFPSAVNVETSSANEDMPSSALAEHTLGETPCGSRHFLLAITTVPEVLRRAGSGVGGPAVAAVVLRVWQITALFWPDTAKNTAPIRLLFD